MNPINQRSPKTLQMHETFLLCCSSKSSQASLVNLLHFINICMNRVCKLLLTNYAIIFMDKGSFPRRAGAWMRTLSAMRTTLFLAGALEFTYINLIQCNN